MDDKFSNEHKHKDKTASSLLYAAITVGLIIPRILLIPLFIILGVGGNPAIFLLFIIAFACVGLILTAFYVRAVRMKNYKKNEAIKTNEEGKKTPDRRFAIAAFTLSFLGVGFFYLVPITGLFGILFLLLMSIIMLPLGMIFGIAALAIGRSRSGRAGIAMSIAAITLPVIAAITYIILANNGYALIRFM